MRQGRIRSMAVVRPVLTLLVYPRLSHQGMKIPDNEPVRAMVREWIPQPVDTYL